MRNKKKSLKCLSVVAVFLVLLIGLPMLCGCKYILQAIPADVFGPAVGKIKDPEIFLKEHCGIELPSEAKVEYNLGVLCFKNEYDYFLVCSYPDIPKEFIGYVDDFEEMNLTDDEINRFIERKNRALKCVLADARLSVDDLDEKFKPHWDSGFVVNWKRYKDTSLSCRVYFPETKQLMVWGLEG